MGRLSLAVLAALGLLIASGVSAGTVLPTLISNDPYVNTTSQHKTQVEPDSFAYGNTIVATFQTGRFFDGGASNIGWATSTDAGVHWTTGMLPGTTIFQGGPYPRISDPAVAYDPMHNVWMISTLAVDEPVFGAAVLASRSTDGGLTWQPPVTTFASTGTFLDKNWIACDTWAQSLFYGHCYQEWDDSRMTMSTSTDGGLTWGTPKFPSGGGSGVGGQPVVLPNGTVVVPYEAGSGTRSFRSTDGGATWQATVAVASISEHNVNGGLRTSPLPSAEVDGGGKVYVTWQDCSFRSGCPANDIVMSTSTDGVTWTAKQRIPIDPTNSGVDHFIPGIAADRNTMGNTAHLALGYYYYPFASCSSSTCKLTMGFISSVDGGATWSTSRQVSPEMSLSWIANTNQGRMVGDYISTSITGDGKAHPVFSLAKAPDGGTCYPTPTTACRQRAATATFSVTGGPTTDLPAKPQFLSAR
jgi:BNR repeat-like domain